MTRFVVMGETHQGAIFVLRRGFRSREAVEEDKRQISRPPDTAPLPWSIEWQGSFTYVRDAEDRRVLSLHGVEARRLQIEAILREAGLFGGIDR